MANKKKTKIIATIGPASHSPEVIKDLIVNGVNLFRLNFSHQSHEYHGESAALIRSVEKEMGANVSILADLCGPKIRVGDLPEPIDLKKGECYTLCSTQDYEAMDDVENVIPISYDNISEEIKVGDRIYIADGTRLLKVVSNDGALVAEARTYGLVRSRKGVNFPDSKLTVSATSDKDMDDLDYILTQDIDWVALSFVMSADDILPLKAKFKAAGKELPVIAKIEKNEALEDIDRIVDAFDALMIARGDLGIEVPIQKIPLIQKQLIAKGRERSKPVIVATQMLESMIEHSVPTRAEVIDVGNAILGGADAMMLSGETAIGNYPVEAVQMMTSVCRELENHYHGNPEFHKYDTTEAIAEAIYHISDSMGIKAIASTTMSGHSAAEISAKHPGLKIYGFSPNHATVKKLNLYRGVYPVMIDRAENGEVLSTLR